MAKSKSVSAKNMAEFRKQAAKLKPVVSRMMAEFGVRLYQEMVLNTKVDSGQAAANWHIVPYKSNPKAEQPQQMLWGFGDTNPMPPVGWKAWSGVKNSETHKEDVIDYVLQFALNMKEGIAFGGFSGVTVYNPISPGFSGFFPNDDSEYEDNALGAAREAQAAAEEKAMNEAESVVAAMFDYVVKK
jgi:hypothetical protein